MYRRPQPEAILDNLPQKLQRLRFFHGNYFTENHLKYDSVTKLPSTLTYLRILQHSMYTPALPRGLKTLDAPSLSLSMDDIDHLPRALEGLTVKEIPLVGTVEALLRLPRTLRELECMDWFDNATDSDIVFEENGQYYSAFPPQLESAYITRDM